MEAQIGSPGAQAAAAGLKHCATESCGEPAVAQIEAQDLCMQHFVSQFMIEAESRKERLQSEPFDSAATESFRKLLADCATQAKELLESKQNFATGKERLLNILLLTSQLHQRLRRSTRTPASVPVWLRREDPGQTWEEATWTSSISRHGAGLVCRHRVEPGRTVYLCRKDRGGRARARVVYSYFDAAGDRQIGVEILDRSDFWDASELAAPQTATATQVKSTEAVAPASSASSSPSTTIQADVVFQLGGRNVEYKQVPLQLVTEGNETHLSGTISARSSDFKLDAGSLPTTDAENEMPVRIEMTWRKEN